MVVSCQMKFNWATIGALLTLSAVSLLQSLSLSKGIRLSKGAPPPQPCGQGNTNFYFLRRALTTPCLKQGYSQGNQDCQLDEIFQNIGTTNKYYVEYGFNTKKQCSGSGPNTCKLWKEHGWAGLLLDGQNENPEINLHAHFLYGDNAAYILQQYNVPRELDFLSGDMDSHDFFVMDNILGHFSPRVVTTEYNRNWPNDFTLSQIDPTLAAGEKGSFKFEECIWGASASSWKLLMESKGYVLVGVSPGLDLIWGRRDLFEGCFDVPSFQDYESLMRLGTLAHKKQVDLLFLNKLVDTKVWKETGDIEQARDVARKTVVKHMESGVVIPCLSEASKLLGEDIV
jgi:hypothetical protein